MFTKYAGTPSEVTIRVGLPDYLNDLNAMHEAERMLLAKCGNDPQDDLWIYYLANLLMSAPLCLREHATAAQRAEAFLRTIGKWEESK
jgi:predicted Zn-dependent protease